MSVAYNGEIKPLDCTTGTPCFLLPAWNAVRAERERERRGVKQDRKKYDC